MSNQIAGLALLGTVTGTGNVELTSVLPNVGSIAPSNLTVGQKAWCILEAGSGASAQREIVWCTYTANTPGTGILSRDSVRFSTSANAKIEFAANTNVTVYFDVPDINTVFLTGDGTFNQIDELRAALSLPVITTTQSVTAGNVTTLEQCNAPNAIYDIQAFNETDPSERVHVKVVTGPDAGSGNATVINGLVILESGDFSIEESGTLINLRNNSGASVVFTKVVSTTTAS